jgi:Flp pilus assembly pilin Flp
MKKFVLKVKRNLIWNENGDFIQNAIWIVLIVLAMIPMFGTLRTALSRAFSTIIRSISQLG